MRVAPYHFRFALAAYASIALSGCRGTIMPELYHPGSAGYQRYNALQYDPYPLDDVAPPVAGARPREYDRPIPEVKRGQTYTRKRPNLQPIAIPSFAPATVPAVTAPPALPGATVSPFAPPANVPYQTPLSAPPPASSMVRPPY